MTLPTPHKSSRARASGHGSIGLLSREAARTEFDPAICVTDSNPKLPDRARRRLESEAPRVPAAGEDFDPASDRPTPRVAMQDHASGHAASGNHGTGAARTPSASASVAVSPRDEPPKQRRRQRQLDDQNWEAAAQDSDPSIVEMKPNGCVGDQGEGRLAAGAHSDNALAADSDPANGTPTPARSSSGREESGEGQCGRDDQSRTALPALIQLWRQRQDLRRAEQRLDLQCQSIIRRFCEGDKEAAAKLWSAIKKNTAAEPTLRVILEPYRMAMTPLDEAARAIEKRLEKMAAALPLWSEWAEGVRGLGALSFAGLIGEAGRDFGEYRSVSALWKRFGLAVFDGTRQRRMTNADEALIHGYAPQRRAYAYVVSTILLRAQREGDPYRKVYDARKEYDLAKLTEIARAEARIEIESARRVDRGVMEDERAAIEKIQGSKAHAHNRALRIMVKALLRDAWRASRKVS